MRKVCYAASAAIGERKDVTLDVMHLHFRVHNFSLREDSEDEEEHICQMCVFVL